MQQYFFSVIIPTYNPREYLPKLLESICRNECKDTIEVIISDDVSEEPFDDIIGFFCDKININVITNDKHYGFPRNGRQNGAEAANGRWICFADQDDYFIDNAFDKIFNAINEENASNYLVTDFVCENAETGEIKIYDRSKGWTHGKFYEKAFWDKYDLCYGEVQYCEDISLSSKIACIIAGEGIQTYEYDTPVYVWRRRSDSLCDADYFIRSMPDYIKATLGTTLHYIKKYKYDQDALGQLNIKFIITLYHFFFYFQSDELGKNKKLLLGTIAGILPLYQKFKEIADLTDEQIIILTNTTLKDIYNSTRADDCKQIPFVEQISFKQWLTNYLA